MLGEDFVQAVKRRCFWPAGVDAAPLSDADILAIADEERRGELAAEITKVSRTFDVVSKDYTLDGARYRLPDRMEGPVKDVVWVDTNDNEWSIDPIEDEDVARQGDVSSSAGREARICRHYIEGDYLVLTPTPSTDGTLRVKFRLAPGALVKSDADQVARVTVAVWDDPSFPDLLAVVPSGTFDPADGDLCDIVSSGNAHSRLLWDSAIGTGLGGTRTFAPASDPRVGAGDYICAPGYTPFVPVPDGFLSSFIRHVAAACLEAAGDREAGGLERNAAQRLDRKAVSSLKPRNGAESPSIVSRNSPLRQGASWKNFWSSR